MKRLINVVGAAFALVLALPLASHSAPKSVGALEFGPDGTLFVADSEAAAIYAIKTGWKASESTEKMESVRDLDAKVASMLGVEAREVFIKDLAVHQASGNAVLSIMRGSGDGAVPVLLTVSRAGQLAELAFDTHEVTKLELGNAPEPDAMMGRSRKARSYTVTDLEYIDGQLYVAGLSNEEFASTLRRAEYPFDGKVETTGLEVYHGAHGAYETNAPIFTFMKYVLNEKPYVVASYLCTPLVTFPVESLTDGSKLRGKTIAELGWGNIPIDMLPYEHEGQAWVLLSNSNRGTMKFKAEDLESWNAKPSITSEVTDAELTRGAPYVGSPLGHVLQLDEYDKDNIMVLSRAADNGALTLGTRGKQWL